MKESAQLFSVTSIAPWIVKRSNGASAVKYTVMQPGDRTAGNNINRNENGKEDQN